MNTGKGDQEMQLLSPNHVKKDVRKALGESVGNFLKEKKAKQNAPPKPFFQYLSEEFPGRVKENIKSGLSVALANFPLSISLAVAA